MVRAHPDPPYQTTGGVAQLGEHLLCKQGVIGSIPFTSTTSGSPGQGDRAAEGWRKRPGTEAAHNRSAMTHGSQNRAYRKVCCVLPLADRNRLLFNNWEEVKVRSLERSVVLGCSGEWIWVKIESKTGLGAVSPRGVCRHLMLWRELYSVIGSSE